MNPITGMLIALCVGKAAANVFSAGKLRHFDLKEFGMSLPFMAVAWLLMVDEFREQLGAPVIISPAAGALMRFDSGSESQHCYGRAGDIMLPAGPDLKTAFSVASRVGFTGIGIYPHWKPSPGLHLDIRPDRKPGNPATWGAIRQGGQQVYVSLQEALTYA